MEQRPRPEIDRRGRSGYYDDRNSFREGPGYAVDGAQLPDAECRGEGSDAPNARIAVGGIGCIEFVAGAYILQIALKRLIQET
jgi:hypothetical protein